MTIDDIIKTNYGAGKGVRISVSFEKLVRTREYESEKVRASMEIDVASDEDVLVETIKAQAMLEYAVMTELLVKRQINQNEFNSRKQELEQALTMMETKVAQLKNT